MSPYFAAIVYHNLFPVTVCLKHVTLERSMIISDVVMLELTGS